MRLLKKVIVLLLAFCPLAGTPAATIKFAASEFKGPGEELMLCDLDGDHRKDVVLVQETNLLIFYQEPQGTFPIAPGLVYKGCQTSGLISHANLDQATESVLVMTSDGVEELCFTNRSTQPLRRWLIHEPTIVPRDLESPILRDFSFAARTATNASPLLLVPTSAGLEVWQHQRDWVRTQTIERAVRQQLVPAPAIPGYSLSFDLDLSIADVNGDQRDDLMVRRPDPGGKESFALYLQTAAGQFEFHPELTTTNRQDSRTWHCWLDVNRDGKVDLIKGTRLDEPWFVPGMRSGKVLVEVYLADAQGHLPSTPQHVFRKNDWMSALPVADLDGDGFPDLALGYGLFDNKEGARKIVTAKKLDFNFKFFLWHPGEGYGKQADFQRDVSTHLDSMAELVWQRVEFGRFGNLTGDFNGDGQRDLLVRDSGNGLSVYFFDRQRKCFDAQAGLTFKCTEPIDRIEVEDLNDDGISDVLLKIHNQDVFKTFISQKH